MTFHDSYCLTNGGDRPCLLFALSNIAAMNTKQRIEWTADEKERLATRVAELRLKKPIPALMALVTEAQKEIFSTERQRNITTLSGLPGFAEKVNVKIDALAKSAKPIEEEKEIMVVHVETPAPVDTKKVLRESGTPEIVAELATRLFSRIENLETSLASIVQKSTQPQSHDQNPPVVRVPRPTPIPIPAVTQSAPRWPVIGIVGLFADQFQHVVEKVQDKNVKLVFLDKEKQQMTVPQNVDYMIVQKHSRHRVWEVSRNTLGPDKVVFADGGISSVVQKIYDILSRQNRLAA